VKEVREWLPQAALANLRLHSAAHHAIEIEQLKGRTDKRASLHWPDPSAFAAINVHGDRAISAKMAFRVPGRRGSIGDIGSLAMSPIPPTATEFMRCNEMSLRANRFLMHCNRRCLRWRARAAGAIWFPGVVTVKSTTIIAIVADKPRRHAMEMTRRHMFRGSVRCRRDDAYAHCARWLGAE
jgi:hypothetical protein